MDILLQLTANAVIAAAVYAIIASGLAIIYATTRVFHLAHGAVIAFGGYFFWWFSSELGWGLFLSGVVAIVIAAITGLLMNELVYEPLRRRNTKGLGYLIATIALLLLSNALILVFFSAKTRRIAFDTALYDVFGARITLLQIILVIVAVALLIGLRFFMARAKLGKAMRATADNETVAEVLGINTVNIRRLAFLIGSVLGGVAGILVALEFNLEPNMGVMMAIKGFTAMVIGGAGSMGGAIVGALILGGVEQAAVWFWGAGWKNAMAFVLLFIFLLVKPTGIFGTKKFS